MDSSSPACVSFIGIVDFTEDANWVYCSESVYDLLGYEPHELIGTSSLNLVHPDEFSEVKELHYTTISQDQAAVLAYLRMRHKDAYKGYILCGISRTVCQNVLVGSVSFAAPGPKAMHNASTAQEVKIITPTAKDLEFRRWNDPNPMPPCPIPPSRSGSPTRDRDYRRDRARAITFDPLPEQSIRTALILDRFSVNCGILYCSNDSLLSTTTCMGRSFFDFVLRKDEDLVRSWIDVIKGWGVNERGQPSDGGFGFGKFTVLVNGRDSSIRHPDPVPSRHRNGSHAHSSHSHADPHSHSHSRTRDARAHHYPTSSGPGHRDRENGRENGRERERDRDRDRERGMMRPPRTTRPENELIVDAIFSAHSDGLMVILRKSSS
ncbi:hypothetical protein TRAPUB_8258 [Trametes pubescens]|uniref:PAS domain-containing protein n=1 Tax=Trametes pubescens TaxID=154538 RepID=A0A1M2W5L4_TRAPU|nr:hypothetical protein TRAPUB_8258 [Trametes pubescens]